MSSLLRSIGLGVVLLLPVVASCPRPLPPPPPPPPIKNPLVPGEPPAKDAKMFRAQMQTYLRKAGPDTPATRETKERFTAALAHGKGVEGVTMNPQAMVCGDRGCFIEVRYQDQVAVFRFDRRMLDDGESPFLKWGWGAGRTVPEAVAESRGGLVATWYFNVPRRWKRQ